MINMAYLLGIGFVILAYLLGSIPSAVWIGRKYYNKDVREHGSLNAGATNTFRVLGKRAGIIVLSMDICKGLAAVLLPKFLLRLNSEHLMIVLIICAVLAIVGHIFPVFAKFRGGKGVATSLGVVIALHPFTALICITIFLIIFVSFQYVSLGAIIASITFPLTLFLIFPESELSLKIFATIMGALVIIMHHKNIKRLFSGNENRMNLFKK
jgi:glycerol-3-phosphate acyltransferase PlsY